MNGGPILGDMVSPGILGGLTLGFLVVVAIGVFVLLSIMAYVRKKYKGGNPPAE